MENTKPFSFDIPVDSQRDLDDLNSEVSTEDFIHSGSDHSSTKDSPDDISISPGDLVTPGNITLGWQRNGGVGAGLQNMGNTCFLNSILQCLTYTCPMVNYLLSGRHDHTWISENFVFGNQEDAHEFLRCLLSAMEDDIQDHPGCYQFSNNSTSVIKEVFGGVLQSQVKCLTCNGEKIRSEEMMDLILDVENASDMLDSLQQFVQADLLEGDNACFCERCDSKKPAAMTSKICSPPNVLTVALRRFCGSTGRKISKDFPFPETFDIRPFMSQLHGPAIKYNLYAVLVHSGTSTWRGHYYSYVKASNGSWYKMNDSLVNKVELSEVLLQKAYLLFYSHSTGAAVGNELKNDVEIDLGDTNRSNKQAHAKPCCKIDTEYLSRCLQDYYTGKGSALPVVPPHIPKCYGMGKASGLKRRRDDDDHDNDGDGDTKRVCHTHDDVGSHPEKRRRDDDDDDHDNDGDGDTKRVCHTHDDVGSHPEKRRRDDDDDDHDNDGDGDTKRVYHTHDDVGSRPELPLLKTTSQGEQRQGKMRKRKRSEHETDDEELGDPKRRGLEWT